MDKDVSQYPIKWKFGLTKPAPWSPAHPHQGVDRPTPKRTPLKVNGRLVGYTGDTGGVEPHHHLQKIVAGKVVDPGSDGFNIPFPAIVFDAGEPEGSEQKEIGRHIRIRDAQGVEWSHFHLDEVKVNKGDIIDNMNEEDKYPNRGDITNFWRRVYRREPNDNDLAYWTKGTKNPAWPKGPAEVWKQLGYETTSQADKFIREMMKATTPESVLLLALTRQFIKEGKDL